MITSDTKYVYPGRLNIGTNMWIYCKIYNNGKCRMLLINVVGKYILFRYLNLINENDFSNCFIDITTNVASRYFECLLHSYSLSQCRFGAPQVLIICRSDFNGGIVRGFHILYIIRMPAKTQQLCNISLRHWIKRWVQASNRYVNADYIGSASIFLVHLKRIFKINFAIIFNKFKIDDYACCWVRLQIPPLFNPSGAPLTNIV